MNQATCLVFSLIFITSTSAAPTADIEGRIVGGDVAKEGQFPYIVSLRTRTFHTCGGSIIAPNVILTAAHCVTDTDASSLTIVAGSLKLSKGGDIYEVREVIVHEVYNHTGTFNDIALLILSNNITLSENTNIVKLRQVDRDVEEPCVLSGWGTKSFTGDLPDDLQYVDLVTTTLESCAHFWIDFHPVFENNTCTMTTSGEGACQGDSGGPLVDSEGNQIGIVSWGSPCAKGWPDVYTRVVSYIDWIKKNGKLD